MKIYLWVDVGWRSSVRVCPFTSPWCEDERVCRLPPACVLSLSFLGHYPSCITEILLIVYRESFRESQEEIRLFSPIRSIWPPSKYPNMNNMFDITWGFSDLSSSVPPVHVRLPHPSLSYYGPRRRVETTTVPRRVIWPDNDQRFIFVTIDEKE